MMMLHRILCPVDFSEPSKRALRYALAIARWHGSLLTVLHVQDPVLHAATFEAGGDPGLDERQYQELYEFIDAAGGNDRTVRVHIATGRVVSAVLEHAARDGSDLIVIGTNGRSGLARAVLGSVTEGVVRQAVVPVLTIPPSADVPEFELMPFDPILCASDFSSACRSALELSILVAQEADARVILMHAMQRPALETGVTLLPVPVAARMDRPEFRKDALARLRAGLPSDAVFRCRPDAIVVEGHPADAILETAYREAVKLIVMGVQARSTLDRLIFGSTTRRVVQAATCPVLSIRARQDAEPWPAWPAAPAPAHSRPYEIPAPAASLMASSLGHGYQQPRRRRAITTPERRSA
jgi:nucleotide-binding universal stress UspA family protein